jgi:hypothetical protein
MYGWTGVKMLTFNEWSETKEMKDWFEKRTNRHIELVRKYCKKIANYDPKRFGELVERAKVHDDSKFIEPEYTPYLFISWQYKCKDEGKEFKPPADLADKMSQATLHHVTTNSHHPEYHSPKKAGLINRENRDKPPKEMVDATTMPDLDVAEMVADWMGMSEEKGTNPKDWADKNVGVRWKFTDAQKKLIYELIEKVWN